ncbi:MAG: aldo/keto reductase [Thermoplasmata archaeon]|nr:aldo/keto reductase [Thermoplasmata archaeon]
MTRFAGSATPEGTARFRERATRVHRLPASHFRIAPGNLIVSSLGLGTYIGAADRVTDVSVEHAVQVSLASGRVNVLDTAINYRHQRAERCIGRSLVGTFARGVAARDEVFVATKHGYISPDSEGPVPVDQYLELELIGKGILGAGDVVDGSHAMSVGYLNDQFERSRTNLGLETIDLVYLHNAADAQLPEVGHDEFFSRLEAAFRLYERLRMEGHLGAYGIATWDALRTPRSHPAHLSLEETVNLARSVGGPDHGFRFVQFPFNLLMPEAATQTNQSVNGERATLFEAVRRLGLGSFTSVPLLQGQLARNGPVAPALTAAQTAIQFARSVGGNLAALIGQKRTEHLSENLRVAELTPWDADRCRQFLPNAPSTLGRSRSNGWDGLEPTPEPRAS